MRNRELTLIFDNREWRITSTILALDEKISNKIDKISWYNLTNGILGKMIKYNFFQVGGLPFHKCTNYHQHEQHQKHHLLQAPMQCSYIGFRKWAALIKLVLHITINGHKGIYILDEYDLLTEWSFCITPLPRGIFFPKNKKENQDFRVSRKYQARKVKHFEYIFLGLLESF